MEDKGTINNNKNSDTEVISKQAIIFENLKPFYDNKKDYELFTSSFMEYYSTKNSVLNESLKTINSLVKDIITNEYLKALDTTYETIELNSKIIDDMLIKNDFKSLIETRFKINLFPKTEMLEGLSSVIENNKLNEISWIINDTISRPEIAVSDVSFLKTASIVSKVVDQIKFPKGFVSSLKKLKKETAYNIIYSNDIVYSTKDNKFVTHSSAIDSVGMNVVSSGKKILRSLSYSDELFSEKELIDFCSELSEIPTLAGTRATGRKIFELIKNLYDNGSKTINFDKDKYYHSRSHNTGEMPFTVGQMLKAPYGLPWAGRFNHVGRSHYYFSDTPFGAKAEIKKHISAKDVIQTICISPCRDVKLLDLSNHIAGCNTFLKYIRFSLADAQDKMPREYLIPCYVSDCCKLIGFEGIKYYGTKDYNNYVVWNDGFFSNTRAYYYEDENV